MMNIQGKMISQGFILAGMLNMSVLIFSRFFTNSTINEVDPDVMSNFGLLMIVVWGLTYISVAKKYSKLKWLVGVFAIEKLIYGYVWLKRILNNDVSKVYDQDVMAGVFYSIYGLSDWTFFGFFLYVFIRISRQKLNNA